MNIEDEGLKNDLIVTIAKHFPFSIEEVKSAYYRLGSFDAVIQLALTAIEFGYGSLDVALYIVRQKERTIDRFLEE